METRRLKGSACVAVAVKNRITPKWVALVNGILDYDLRSDSWCLFVVFDPHPRGSSK